VAAWRVRSREKRLQHQHQSIPLAGGREGPQGLRQTVLFEFRSGLGDRDRDTYGSFTPQTSSHTLRASYEQERRMRTTAGMVLAVVLAAALAMWIQSSSHRVRSTEPPAEASSTPMLPIELMKKSDKNLPDKTVREPF
jgi:hypothetical protein